MTCLLSLYFTWVSVSSWHWDMLGYGVYITNNYNSLKADADVCHTCKHMYLDIIPKICSHTLSRNGLFVYWKFLFFAISLYMDLIFFFDKLYGPDLNWILVFIGFISDDNILTNILCVECHFWWYPCYHRKLQLILSLQPWNLRIPMPTRMSRYRFLGLIVNQWCIWAKKINLQCGSVCISI